MEQQNVGTIGLLVQGSANGCSRRLQQGVCREVSSLPIVHMRLLSRTDVPG
jgi:hypothetical protein